MGFKNIANELEALPHELRERMKFFESHLYWFGWARRKDMADMFKISSERAYQAIKTYKEICGEEGFEYSYKEKRYVIKNGFTPKMINTDISGFISFLERGEALINIYDVSQLFFNNVSTDIIRSVCFSIASNKPMVCEYLSMSSGRHQRAMQPHSLFYDGLKSYARSFCFRSEEYRDFCLSRITRVDKFDIPPGNLPRDKEWDEIETVEIAPVRGLTEEQRKAVEMDFCMEDGVGRIEMRKPLVYYFIRRYNLDRPHFKDPVRQQIVTR